MSPSKQNIAGVSLVEVILALVIAGMIIVMGLRQFQIYRTDAAAQRIRYNAEEIMRGAAYYYYANCKNSSGVTATLDPANFSGDTYTSATVSTLVSNGYLMAAPALNPLVDSSGASGGYLLQFNRSISIRYYCTSSSSCDPIGNDVIWRIQVSVLLKNTSAASRYLKMTGADCLTTSSGTNKVETCANAVTFETNCKKYRDPADPAYNPTTANNMGCPAAGGTYNNYLSWERLPSMASPKGQSPLWITNPVVKQFKQLNDNMPSLSYMLANPTSTNFLCGG